MSMKNQIQGCNGISTVQGKWNICGIGLGNRAYGYGWAFHRKFKLYLLTNFIYWFDLENLISLVMFLGVPGKSISNFY